MSRRVNSNQAHCDGGSAFFKNTIDRKQHLEKIHFTYNNLHRLSPYIASFADNALASADPLVLWNFENEFILNSGEVEYLMRQDCMLYSNENAQTGSWHNNEQGYNNNNTLNNTMPPPPSQPVPLMPPNQSFAMGTSTSGPCQNITMPVNPQMMPPPVMGYPQNNNMGQYVMATNNPAMGPPVIAPTNGHTPMPTTNGPSSQHVVPYSQTPYCPGFGSNTNSQNPDIIYDYQGLAYRRSFVMTTYLAPVIIPTPSTGSSFTESSGQSQMCSSVASNEPNYDEYEDFESESNLEDDGLDATLVNDGSGEMTPCDMDAAFVKSEDSVVPAEISTTTLDNVTDLANVAMIETSASESLVASTVIDNNTIDTVGNSTLETDDIKPEESSEAVPSTPTQTVMKSQPFKALGKSDTLEKTPVVTSTPATPTYANITKLTQEMESVAIKPAAKPTRVNTGSMNLSGGVTNSLPATSTPKVDNKPSLKNELEKNQWEKIAQRKNWCSPMERKSNVIILASPPVPESPVVSAVEEDSEVTDSAPVKPTKLTKKQKRLQAEQKAKELETDDFILEQAMKERMEALGRTESIDSGISSNVGNKTKKEKRAQKNKVIVENVTVSSSDFPNPTAPHIMFQVEQAIRKRAEAILKDGRPTTHFNQMRQDFLQEVAEFEKTFIFTQEGENQLKQYLYDRIHVFKKLHISRSGSRTAIYEQIYVNCPRVLLPELCYLTSVQEDPKFVYWEEAFFALF